MRSATPALAMMLAFGCGGSTDMGEFQKNLPRRAMDPPSDVPDWSKSEFVRWASVKVIDERALFIDVPGGALDQLLDHEDVTASLNADYRAIFLHPRARPDLTAHLSWPSVTLLDKRGCLRGTAQPATTEALAAFLLEGMKARADGVELPLPARKAEIPPIPEGGGTWTADDPSAAAVFVQPERGAPAVIWNERPWIYGNRSDAELLADRPAARSFLESIPEDHSYLVSEGPVMKCPLPIPEPPKPAVEEEGADAGSGG